MIEIPLSPNFLTSTFGETKTGKVGQMRIFLIPRLRMASNTMTAISSSPAILKTIGRSLMSLA